MAEVYFFRERAQPCRKDFILEAGGISNLWHTQFVGVYKHSDAVGKQ